MNTINRTLTCIDTPADSITFSASTTDVRFVVNGSEVMVKAEDIRFDDGECGCDVQVIAHRRCDNQMIVIVNCHDLEAALNDCGNTAVFDVYINS